MNPRVCLRCGYPVDRDEPSCTTKAGVLHTIQGCSRRLATMRSELGRQRDLRAALRADPARSIDPAEALLL